MAQNIIKFESSVGTKFYATGITSRDASTLSKRNYGGPRVVVFKGFSPETPEVITYLEIELALGLDSFTMPGRDKGTGEPFPTVSWRYVGTESISESGR